MKTAKAWGKTPDEWDALSESNRAQMMAFEETISTMTAYDEQEAERKQDPAPKTPTRRPGRRPRRR